MADDVLPPILPRAKAISLGLKRYFTGVPCHKGHVAERHVRDCYCVPCSNESRESYRAANPELSKKWRAARYAANKEKIKTDKHAWYLDNREKLKQRRQQRAANDVEFQKRRLAERHKYRARVLNSEGSYIPEDIERIFTSQKGKCAYCRVSIKKKYDIDHITPLSRGGSNWPNNLQLLCPACNRSKGGKDPIDHIRELGKLL